MRGTHDTVVLLQGRGGSTTDLHVVLVDVDISLADEVLDLVQPRFQLPTIKDHMIGWGIRHTRQAPVVVEVRLNGPCCQRMAIYGVPEPTPDWFRLIRSQLRSDDDPSGRGEKKDS